MIKIRSLLEGDIQFIKSAWIDHQATQRYYKRTPRSIIKRNLAPLVLRLIGESLILVACSEEDENQIMGFMVYNDVSLHFIYTKLVYRNFGIFKKLIESAAADFDNYTAFTEDRTFLEYAKKNKIVFNPWGSNENFKIETGGINSPSSSV